MRYQRAVMVAGALALAAAAPLAAQNECSGVPLLAQSACNRAVDSYKTFLPLGGIVISGGNPELGTARALGGFGHLFLSARVNAVKAVVPNPDTTQASISGTVPAPVVETGIGLFRGLSGGLLAVDALASATLLPTGLDKFSVDTGAAKIGDMALGVGYGARIGILNGSFPIPSVSVSWMRRTLPRVQVGNLTQGDDFEFDTDLKATNIRVAASMRFIMFDVAAGVGFDKYSSTGHIRANGMSEVTVPVDNKRQVLFLDAGMNLALLKLVGELGYQTGKDQQLSASYSDFDPKAGHTYGSVGLRFSF
jgi:hypothetical protein